MIEYCSKRRNIIIFAVVVMALTMVPYLVGYAQQGEEWRYTGFVIGVEDGNSYVAKMLSGSYGSWLFRSPHSAVEQNGVIAYLPYILLGKLASGPAQHDQLIVLYHLARFVFGSFAILATYDFAAIFIKQENLRWWALVFITLGGGLGWILVSISQKGYLGSIPLEFISPESFGFLGIFGFPHLAAARALFLWGLVAFIKFENGYITGVLWLIMGFFQPMVVVIAWAVIGSYNAIAILHRYFYPKYFLSVDLKNSKELLIEAVRAVAISCPIVIYTAYIFLRDPYFKVWSMQNRFPSPHFFHYLVAYGLVLPFTIMGIRKLIKSRKHESLMLASWLIMAPFLIYAPVITQRRLAEGLWVVLIIGFVGNYINSDGIPWYARGLLLLLLPSSLFIFLGSILTTAKPSEPIFRNSDEILAYEFIAEFTEKDNVILSSFEIGNNLPAWAPVRVVMGHGPETIGLDRIQSDISAFFDFPDAYRNDCSEFFEKFDVDYLFWGPFEKNTWKAEPGDIECLVEIYNNEGYSLYEVNYPDK